jgi:stearoyl-CoA desaturase (delta-9 desaturase)
MLSAITQDFPPTNGIRWFNVGVLTLTPLLAVYGLWTVKIQRDTGFFAVAYYIFSMLGEIRGPHTPASEN